VNYDLIADLARLGGDEGNIPNLLCAMINRRSFRPWVDPFYALISNGQGDCAAHAEDFSRRYAPNLHIVAGQTMMDLSIPKDQVGANDPDRGSTHFSSHPGDRTGGSVSPPGRSRSIRA
jgi:hypothetical protein